MNLTLKQIATTALKFALPAVIIGWLLWRIEPEQWRQLHEQPKNYALLAAALAVALAATSISFFRWCLLVRCQGIQLSVVEAFRLGSIGFLLSFVSAGSVGGDVFKALFLARRSPGKRIEAVASVLVDRGSGMFGLLLIVSIGLWLATPAEGGEAAANLAQIGRATAILMVVGTAVLAVLVLGGRTIDRLIAWLQRVPLLGVGLQRVAQPLRMFHTHPVGFGWSIALSVVVQALMVVGMYLVARGLYRQPPTFGEHFVIVPVGMLASALPITPAGLGVLEAAIEWMYDVVPAVPTEASGTLVALVFEIVKIVLAVLGVIFYWTAGRDVRQSLEMAQSQNAAAIEPAAG